MNAKHTVAVCCTSQHHSEMPARGWEIFLRFSTEIAVYLADDTYMFFRWISLITLIPFDTKRQER